MPDWGNIWESVKNYFILSGVLLSFMAWLWLCTGGTVQLASVTGRIECPSDPNRIFNVTVKLDELDTAPIRYIHMDNTSTNESGEFALSGIAADLLGTIDAVVRIYHHCNVDLNATDCYRKLTFKVPPEFISFSRADMKVFDLNTINLDPVIPNEERHCGSIIS